MAHTISRTRRQPRSAIADKTIWEMFEAERAVLLPYRGAFDGVRDVTAAGVADPPAAV